MIRSAQVKAAVKVNAEKLLFNWQLGRDLVKKKAEEHWGAGVVEQVSLDMQREFPDENGFSVRNLWNMKKWFLFYSESTASQILHQAGAELQIIHPQNLGTSADRLTECSGDPPLCLLWCSFSLLVKRNQPEKQNRG